MSSAVERRVVELLRTLHVAREAWDDRSGGGGVKMMPSLYSEGSYAELEVALRSLRDGAPREHRLWWHVSERYLRGEERVARVSVRRFAKGPVVTAPEHSEVVVVIEMHKSYALARLRVWSDRVDEKLVDAGVREIASRMYGGDHGRVVLPRELLPYASV